MGRTGRKRKQGKRYPSGQLVPDKRPDDRVRTSRQPHRRSLKPELRLDERAESPLGRLLLTGKLNAEGDPVDPELKQELEEARYYAGMLYAQVVGAYRAVIEAPRGTAGTGRQAEGCAGGCDLLRKLFGAKFVECACERRKARYDRAYEALVSTAGQRGAKAVARMAIHREEIAPVDFVYLTAGLDALAQHFGLTRRRRAAHSGNAN